jgi:hypothetical protein
MSHPAAQMGYVKLGQGEDKCGTRNVSRGKKRWRHGVERVRWWQYLRGSFLPVFDQRVRQLLCWEVWGLRHLLICV